MVGCGSKESVVEQCHNRCCAGRRLSDQTLCNLPAAPPGVLLTLFLILLFYEYFFHCCSSFQTSPLPLTICLLSTAPSADYPALLHNQFFHAPFPVLLWRRRQHVVPWYKYQTTRRHTIQSSGLIIYLIWALKGKAVPLQAQSGPTGF